MRHYVHPWLGWSCEVYHPRVSLEVEQLFCCDSGKITKGAQVVGMRYVPTRWQQEYGLAQTGVNRILVPEHQLLRIAADLIQ